MLMYFDSNVYCSLVPFFYIHLYNAIYMRNIFIVCVSWFDLIKIEYFMYFLVNWFCFQFFCLF
jgi:hypothetical protein